MSPLRPRQEDLDWVSRLLELRDGARLAGHTDSIFQVVDLDSADPTLFGPGGGPGVPIPSLVVSRLGGLDLLHVVTRAANSISFDLVDDVRDQLELLREAMGRPSLIERERTARARAEDQQSALEVRLEAGARRREELRQAFAGRVGRWISGLTVALLVGVYAGATVVVALLATPAIAVVVAVIVLGAFGILEWGFHLDALVVAHWLERLSARRVERWLARFETSDPDE